MKRSLPRLMRTLLALLLVIAACPVPYARAAYTITPHELGDQVRIHTDAQAAYLLDSMQNISSYATGYQEISQPQSVTLSWSVNPSTPSGSYKVRLSTSPELYPYEEYTTASASLNVNNLEIGRTYYWRVSLKLNNTTYTSAVSSFTTERTAPRNLSVSGVANVRDLGGYTTCDGKVVRQGRIYRCGRLNENESTALEITSDGISEFVDRLGIRSEIDLRKDDESGNLSASVLGRSVNYYRLPMEHGDCLVPENIAPMREFFYLLADEDNYPLIFHCSIGTDRTGMMAYLLDGLLGVSETDLMRDYLYSGFSSIYGTRQIEKIVANFPAAVKRQSGETMQEKVFNYLKNVIGVSAQTLERVIALNTEEAESADGYLEVSSESDFLNMQPGKKYRLTNSITVTQSYAGDFAGTLDGGGNTVTAQVPLFQSLSGTVRNLNICGSVSAAEAIGALAVTARGALIEDVTCSADVCSDTAAAGGLVGKSSATTMFIRCTGCGTVSGVTVGGIIGHARGALTLSECENRGTLQALSALGYAGGLVGRCTGAALLQKCLNSGDVFCAGKYAGGIIGYMDQTLIMQTILSCCNSAAVCGTAESGLCTIGGIIGCLRAGSCYDTISACVNEGDLSSSTRDKATLAGICGEVDSDSIILKYCTVSGLMSAVNSSSYSYYTLFCDASVPLESNLGGNGIENICFTQASESALLAASLSGSASCVFYQKDGASDALIAMALYRDGKMLRMVTDTVGAKQLLIMNIPLTQQGGTVKAFCLSSGGFRPLQEALTPAA